MIFISTNTGEPLTLAASGVVPPPEEALLFKESVGEEALKMGEN